jgi:hypothetical protein
MNHILFLNRVGCINEVVVTPVIAGVDTPSIAVQLVPSNSSGLLTPLLRTNTRLPRS